MRRIYHLITSWSEPPVLSHLFKYHCNIFCLWKTGIKYSWRWGEVIVFFFSFFFHFKSIRDSGWDYRQQITLTFRTVGAARRILHRFLVSFLILAAKLFETLSLPCQRLCMFFFFLSRFYLVSLFEVPFLFFFFRMTVLDWINSCFDQLSGYIKLNCK